MISKGVTCFRGCGQTIYFHDQIVSKTGKKIPLDREIETLEEINLILSKQQEAPAHQCPNNPQQQSWSGTNKQGQFVQAKISQEANRAQMEINNIILKMLTDSSQILEQRFYELNERTKRMEEMLQVIYIAGKYDQVTTIEEPKTAGQEMTEQKHVDSTSHIESDYVL